MPPGVEPSRLTDGAFEGSPPYLSSSSIPRPTNPTRILERMPVYTIYVNAPSYGSSASGIQYQALKPPSYLGTFRTRRIRPRSPSLLPMFDVVTLAINFAHPDSESSDSVPSHGLINTHILA